MEFGKVHLNIDPFKIAYRDQYFPLAPDGSPTEIGDFSDALVHNLLLDIPPLLFGEIRSIGFLDDPHELILIPWGDEITIFLYTQVTEYFVNWQQITVPTGAWFSAVIRATRQYIEMESNSGSDPSFVPLEEIWYLCGFTEKLLQVRGYLEQEEDVPC